METKKQTRLRIVENNIARYEGARDIHHKEIDALNEQIEALKVERARLSGARIEEETIHVKQYECPHCGNDNLLWEPEETHDGNFRTCQTTCRKCGWTFIEHYEVKYLGTQVTEDGEYLPEGKHVVKVSELLEG